MQALTTTDTLSWPPTSSADFTSAASSRFAARNAMTAAISRSVNKSVSPSEQRSPFAGAMPGRARSRVSSPLPGRPRQLRAGRICMHRKKINISRGARRAARNQGSRRWHLARQLPALRSWIYRLGTKDVANTRQPVRREVVTHVAGTFCYPCLRNVH